MHSEGSTTTDGTLEEQIERFLLRNFPQIRMHGGDAAIEAIDEESGEVWLRLSGACSGCGISPMTIQALKSRLVAEFDAIDTVHAETGMGSSGAPDPDREFEDVPF